TSAGRAAERDVPGRVQAGEAAARLDRTRPIRERVRAGGGYPVVEEPEADVRVATVREKIAAEEQDPVTRARRSRTGVLGREGVLEVGLVRRRGRLLPLPGADVGVVGAALEDVVAAGVERVRDERALVVVMRRGQDGARRLVAERPRRRRGRT